MSDVLQSSLRVAIAKALRVNTQQVAIVGSSWIASVKGRRLVAGLQVVFRVILSQPAVDMSEQRAVHGMTNKTTHVDSAAITSSQAAKDLFALSSNSHILYTGLMAELSAHGAIPQNLTMVVQKPVAQQLTIRWMLETWSPCQANQSWGTVGCVRVLGLQQRSVWCTEASNTSNRLDMSFCAGLESPAISQPCYLHAAPCINNSDLAAVSPQAEQEHAETTSTTSSLKLFNPEAKDQELHTSPRMDKGDTANSVSIGHASFIILLLCSLLFLACLVYVFFRVRVGMKRLDVQLAWEAAQPNSSLHVPRVSSPSGRRAVAPSDVQQVEGHEFCSGGAAELKHDIPYPPRNEPFQFAITRGDCEEWVKLSASLSHASHGTETERRSVPKSPSSGIAHIANSHGPHDLHCSSNTIEHWQAATKCLGEGIGRNAWFPRVAHPPHHRCASASSLLAPGHGTCPSSGHCLL